MRGAGGARRGARLYRLLAALLLPAARWGRLRVTGLEAVPARGALLVVPNHDSQWDPVMIGIAIRARRPLRFLARANLWSIRGLGPILTAIGQLPVERGVGDRGALANALRALHGGNAVCIFPEGKLSLGERLPARSGIGWLARDCPDAKVVLCAVDGATDFVRFPRRPRASVTFFEPELGPPRPGEEPRELSERLLGEVRRRVPPRRAGRKP